MQYRRGSIVAWWHHGVVPTPCVAPTTALRPRVGVVPTHCLWAMQHRRGSLGRLLAPCGVAPTSGLLLHRRGFLDRLLASGELLPRHAWLPRQHCASCGVDPTHNLTDDGAQIYVMTYDWDPVTSSAWLPRPPRMRVDVVLELLPRLPTKFHEGSRKFAKFLAKPRTFSQRISARKNSR